MATMKKQPISSQLALHLSWKERILSESVGCVKSLETSRKLGFIEGMQKNINDPKIPPSEQFYDDKEFQNLIKESGTKFPAKNLWGFSVSPREISPDLIKKYKHNETPFGLYPVFNNNINSISGPVMYSPVRTSLRCYAGKSRLRIFFILLKFYSIYEKFD